MTPRRVTTLLIVGLLVIGLAMWVSSTRHLERATAAGDLVMPGLTAGLNSITEVRVRKGDGTATTLKKGSSSWRVGERDYPADSGKVRKLLLDLAALKVVEEKTRTPENYPQLGVEEVNSPQATGTLVEAVAPGKTYGLIVGKSSDAKSGYVRMTTSPQSVLAAPLLSLDADARHWIDRTLIDLPLERIKEVNVKIGAQPAYTLSRANKEQSDFAVADVPKGRELLTPDAANSIASALTALTSDDVHHAPASNSAQTDLVHATYRTFDGLVVDVTGRKDGTADWIAIAASATQGAVETEARDLTTRVQGWEYEIPGYKYDALFRPLADLLKKPPEKAPAKIAGKAGKETGSAGPGKQQQGDGGK
ncbi:MAG TPA: DUF4340 domain-containing protein [Steroidobacteraceae bacterium]|nr:DUF4340 domain-containing protein [Steroidobacteraceae bacterium]